jgi:hypothetical protein
LTKEKFEKQGECVKKLFLTVLFLTAFEGGAYIQKFPQNIVVETTAVYVAAGDTADTRLFLLSARAWRRGKIAIYDTNIVSQDTIDIGTGVKILQYVCFPTGNLFGYDSTIMDTLCDLCGDSAGFPFVNIGGLSGDSLILATMDTSEMKLTSLGGDSLWVSNGYFQMQSDASGYTRFRTIGNSDLGATVKRIVFIIESFLGEPVYNVK